MCVCVCVCVCGGGVVLKLTSTRYNLPLMKTDKRKRRNSGSSSLGEREKVGMKILFFSSIMVVTVRRFLKEVYVAGKLFSNLVTTK